MNEKQSSLGILLEMRGGPVGIERGLIVVLLVEEKLPADQTLTGGPGTCGSPARRRMLGQLGEERDGFVFVARFDNKGDGEADHGTLQARFSELIAVTILGNHPRQDDRSPPARADKIGVNRPRSTADIGGDDMTLSADARLSIASTDEIRAGFPALERVHHGHRVAYFDGPGGTQVPSAVVEAMIGLLDSPQCQHPLGFSDQCRDRRGALGRAAAIADFLNASPDEIGFGLNMTTLTFHLARAIGRRLGPGDAIVVTELDHHANIDPWRALERERGITILQVRMVPETGELDWNDLDRCLTDHRVKLLAIGAASNALGTINDVARAVAMAREANALSFVDAVHYAPTSWSTSGNGAATFWRARPTSFMGRTSACFTASERSSRN